MRADAYEVMAMAISRMPADHPTPAPQTGEKAE